jgi:hypothetical protein
MGATTLLRSAQGEADRLDDLSLGVGDDDTFLLFQGRHPNFGEQNPPKSRIWRFPGRP